MSKTTTTTTTLYKDLPDGSVFRFVGVIEKVPYGKLFKKRSGLEIVEVNTGKVRQCSSMFAPVDAGFVDLDAAPVTTQAQPTPTPWHVASDEVTIVKPHVQANSEFAKQQGYIVARSCFSREESADTPKGGQWTEETKANARFIVKAVNNHQKLVDALNMIAAMTVCSDAEVHKLAVEALGDSYRLAD